MSFLITAFNTILYRPLFNVLVLLYLYVPGRDFGIAVIALTILIRLLIYPLGVKAVKSQKAMAEIQPKVKEIQEKFKDDKTAQAKAVMELYQKAKINPFSGLLPLLIQFPVLLALFRVFWRGLSQDQMTHLYSFIPAPSQINPVFLGIIDLSQPFAALAILAGVCQFVQSKTMTPKQSPGKKKQGDFSEMFQKQMLYFFPVFTVLIVWRLPSAIALYWIVSSLFSIVQQHYVKPDQNKSN